MPKQFNNFTEFYPYYLTFHSKNLTRSLHFSGLALAYLIGAFGVATYLSDADRDPRHLLFVALAPIVAYGLSWCSHYFVEKNAPATLERPLWSLMADHKMMYKAGLDRLHALVGR